jgi:RNA polymerase sigma-70 factor (ECF subfamily)
VETAVADAHRREWSFVMAATVRVTGDIELAEECVQDAYAKALATWPTTGVPRSPGAWLTTVARRRALDLKRRATTHDRTMPLVAAGTSREADGVEATVEEELTEVSDDRLRLVFTCCHPALSTEAKVALTLRLVCGLSTAEVARAFLVQEPTMAARLTRAKKKIAAARIPYVVPARDELSDRIDGVLEVVHLLFTTGHTAPAGAELVRRDLVARAEDLARMLRHLLPDEAEVVALLALILLTDARRNSRVDHEGRLLTLADQDRREWDQAAIAEGVVLVRRALRRRPPGRFALMAAIAAVHAEAPSFEATDWKEIVGLYDVLRDIWPSPVVALNRAVAVGFAEGPAKGLAELDPLTSEPVLAGYPYLAASRADFLRRLGKVAEARLAYEEALMLSENEIERRFLMGRLDRLPG